MPVPLPLENNQLHKKLMFSYLLKGYLGKLFYTLYNSDLYRQKSMAKENHSYLFEQISELIKYREVLQSILQTSRLFLSHIHLPYVLSMNPSVFIS